MYPFAITIMPIRMGIFIILMLSLSIFNTIMLIGVKKDTPIPLFRKKIMHFFFQYLSFVLALDLGCMI